MHQFSEIISFLGHAPGLIPLPGLADHLPALKVYFGIFASAPVFLVTLAFYFIALLTAAAAALTGLYLGIAVTRALVVIALIALFGIYYAVSKKGLLCPRIRALRKIGDGPSFVRRYGAKAVNLAKLMRAGFPVPDGYAVAKAPGPSDIAGLQKLVKKIGKRFCGGKVIVRSSFAGEDSEEASYSGVFASVPSIDPRDADALAGAVGQVAASTRNTGRIYGGKTSGGPLSIVVQEQIEHSLAGFAFSVDVSSGRTQRLLVEVHEGAGATYGVDRISAARGCILGDADAIDDDLLTQIVEATDKAADLFGAPTQIEWGYDDGRLWIYQARPILKAPDLSTWIVAPGLESIKALTPLSQDILYSGGDAGGALAKLGLLGDEHFRDHAGKRFVDWNALESAKRKLRKGDLTPRQYFQILKLFMNTAKAEPFDPGAPLAVLIEALHREIKRQQDNRLCIDAMSFAGSFLCGGLISPDRIENLFALGDDNPFINMGRDLDRLMQSGRIDEAVKRYPFLPNHENELAADRAADDPKILKAFAFSDAPQINPDKTDEVSAILKSTQRDTLVRWLPFVISRIGRSIRRRRLDAENGHINILKINDAIKRRALALASEKGVMPDDVFYLKLDELIGDAKAMPDAEAVEKRRQRYFEQISSESEDVLHFCGRNKVNFNSTQDAADELRGVGIGRGLFTGELIAPEDASKPGEGFIVLCADTSINWLGVLREGRPVLCLKGGILSHLANVAREIGAPIFIIGRAAQEIFQPGDRIKIDFDRGVVRHV